MVANRSGNLRRKFVSAFRSARSSGVSALDPTSAAPRSALKAYRFKKGSVNNPVRLSRFYYQCRQIFHETAPELARAAIKLALAGLGGPRHAATEMGVRPPTPFKVELRRLLFSSSSATAARHRCGRLKRRIARGGQRRGAIVGLALAVARADRHALPRQLAAARLAVTAGRGPGLISVT